ncbi:Stk1 family PASTA domain-containing Ser/Thr kinase [Actinotalea sp. Marseille-Q4924]|uniref:Stk1 family PASTA domain-containing Ser/Thr kinase n=1 Tax=Actinotalea sp. Marseille-Q4924 TaxID=2866571 RepID=UPI00271522EB|nr:Stk1 family PASTA domain-containing Ser/Thr kinase [Actinotalea sp. Marseille-Q4924]
MVDDAPRMLGGRYEVGELIGRGGMAEVHIGHDTRLGRTVAIKILRSDLARDPSFQARFRREAQAAASLNHPAIVAVYDTGEDVHTDHAGTVHHVPFIVMEYVEGHTVRDILRDGSAVPIEEAVEITVGVLSALEYSHHAGIVHRDIKPANVMLTPTGAVKVMDFGIARAMADAAGTMTQTQAVIGTAQYLSPEQARGEAVDARSDLYSTGCLLFELLTGRPPFIGDSPVAVAYQHAREEAQPPSTFASDVPESLDRITVKALAKDRDDRYPTAGDFRADLESSLRGGHVDAPPVGAIGAAAAAAGLAAAGAAQAYDGNATQVMRPGGGGETQVMGAAGAGQQTRLMGAAAPAAVPPQSSWSQVQTGQQPIVPPGDRDDDEPRRRGLLWTLIAVAVLAALGIILVLTLGDGEEPLTQVEVPDVVGATAEEARAEIEGLGLVFEPLEVASADVPVDAVVETDPPAGTMLDPGEAVRVSISNGPDAVQIPVLENFTQEQARAELADLGITNVTTETVDHPSIAEGRVVGTTPGAGESIAPSDPVVLQLSSGQVELPDLTGVDEATARQALVDLGLTPVITQEESDQPAGTVVRQSRTPGPVPQRSEVELVIATEPQPQNVAVPELFNLTVETAEQRLNATALNLGAQTQEASEEVEAGRVIRTSPTAGSQIPEGSTVDLVVSSGPAEGEGGGNNGEGGGGGGEGGGGGD